jgi:hypothetical protein
MTRFSDVHPLSIHPVGRYAVRLRGAMVTRPGYSRGNDSGSWQNKSQVTSIKRELMTDSVVVGRAFLLY